MANTTWELLYSNLKPKRVKYVRSVVSYLDILGFGDLIKTRTAGEISRILRILGESVKPEDFLKHQRVRSIRFSDTVIRTTPATPRNLVDELRSIISAQLALIPEDIAIRGAVTIGDVVQSWGIVYGPGIIRAYDLERVKGSPPRIIVDQDILGVVEWSPEKEELRSELSYLLAKDGSITYIDYLRACERDLNVPEQEYPMFLEIHRDFVHRGLTKYASKGSILPKYKWLSTYHNHTVKEYFDSVQYAAPDSCRKLQVHM